MSSVLERTVEQLVERAGTTYYGKYRGTVTNVDDPDNRGRIRATVPAVLGIHECGWAMPASPFAGDGHGFLMLPNVGSAVWIEFEAGQLDDPIWSGGWWAQGQAPNPGGRNIRVIVSDQGHKIVLDDSAGEVTVTHGKGPEIKLKSNEMTLTVGACSIKITDTAISMNDGVVKVGPAGVSLANGAMSFGVPPT